MAGMVALLGAAVAICLFGSTLAAAAGNGTATDPKPAKAFGRPGIIWPPQPPHPPGPPVGWPPKPPQPPVPPVVWPPKPPHPPVPPVVWPPKPPHPPVPPVVWPPKPPHPPVPPVVWPPKPPHPPQQTCNVCDKLETGFTQSLHYLQAIHNKLWDCAEHCPAGIRRAIGPMMPTGDDDPSVAVCPTGYQVLSCRCTIENRLCDGVFVDGQQCTAYRSSVAGPAIQAVANCVKIGKNEEYQVVRNPASGWTQDPLASCPPLFQLIDCFIRSPWMPAVFVQTEMDLTLNSCKPSSSCTAVNGCAVQALCKKI